MDCPYSERHKKGLTQWMTCKVSNDLCYFVRMCRTQNTVVNTDGAKNCKIRMGVENNE